MDVVVSVVVVVALVLLLLEGARCLLTPRPTSIGALDLLFAGVLAFVLLAVSSGSMVLAPELGTIMVQGTVSRWLLRLALVVTAIVPGLWWYRIRSMKGWRSPLPHTLMLGLVVGSWAASHVNAFNPDDPEALVVFRYDVWWPPLIVWLAICFVGSLSDLANAVVPRSVRGAVAAALVASLASFALSFQDLPDGQSRAAWTVLERAGGAVALMLLGYALITKNVKRLTWLRAIIWVGVLTSISAASAILTISSGARATGNLCVLSVCVAAVIIFNRKSAFRGAFRAITAEVEKLRAAAPAAAAAPPESQKGGSAEDGMEAARIAVNNDRPHARELAEAAAIATWLSSPIMAFLLADLLSIGLLNRGLDLSLLLCFWLFLSERLAGGAVVHWPGFIRKHLDLRKERQQARSKQEPSFKADPATPKGWREAGKTLARTGKTLGLGTILVVIVLVVVSEGLDYRPLVIQTFQWTGAKDAKDDISKDVTDGLINALGRMREDLRTDLIIAMRQSSGEHPSTAGLRALQAGSEVHTVETAVAKSGDFKIANINIPLGFFVSPIQQIMRSLLKARVVTGTVNRTADGNYLIRVNGSDGHSWHEGSDVKRQPLVAKSAAAGASPESECVTEPENRIDQAKDPIDTTPASAGVPGAGMILDVGFGTRLVISREMGRDLLEWFQGHGHADRPVDDLIERLAFDVASSDPSFIDAGMTKDWAAFRYFRTGLSQWQAGEARQDEQAQGRAIACFRSSLNRDPGFTMAAYRLGLARRRVGQPAAAVIAFRQATKTNPRFAAGALEEAATLYDFNEYYRSPALMGRYLPDWSKRDQALRTWIDLIMRPPAEISVSERRSADIGVCRYELDRQGQDSDPEPDRSYLAYFFCSRAAELFSQLAPVERRSAEEKDLQVTSLDGLGVALEMHGSRFLPAKSQAGRQWPLWRSDWSEQLWSCAAIAVDREEIDASGSVAKINLWGSPNSRAALGYYRRGLELEPDEHTLQCNAANAAAYLEVNTKSMEVLRNNPEAHLALGLEFRNSGIDAAHTVEGNGAQSDRDRVRAKGYYFRALAEFETAIVLDPTLLDALIGAAGTYWQLRLDYVMARSSATVGLASGLEAEAYARAAVKLARIRFDNDLDAGETLGEVLLGQGRFSEAIKQLEATVGYAVLHKPYWQNLNEARWDLAQARVCAAAGEATVERREQLEQAEQVLSEMRASDESAEKPQFVSDQGAFDTSVLQSHCQGLLDQSASGDNRFLARNPAYSAGPTCQSARVLGRVEGASAAPGAAFVLHVWGGGVDVRVDLGDEGGGIVLDKRSVPSGGLYYARLEQSHRGLVSWVEVLSSAQALAVFGADGSDCSRNQADIVFYKAPEPADQS